MKEPKRRRDRRESRREEEERQKKLARAAYQQGRPCTAPNDLMMFHQPRFAPRVQAPTSRGCIVLPSLILPETFRLHPEYSRAYMDQNGILRCLPPCSSQPFRPFHSACGSGPDQDQHSGHQCCPCKEFTDAGRCPGEWFDYIPPMKRVSDAQLSACPA